MFLYTCNNSPVLSVPLLTDTIVDLQESNVDPAYFVDDIRVAVTCTQTLLLWECENIVSDGCHWNNSPILICSFAYI